METKKGGNELSLFPEKETDLNSGLASFLFLVWPLSENPGKKEGFWKSPFVVFRGSPLPPNGFWSGSWDSSTLAQSLGIWQMLKKKPCQHAKLQDVYSHLIFWTFFCGEFRTWLSLDSLFIRLERATFREAVANFVSNLSSFCFFLKDTTLWKLGYGAKQPWNWLKITAGFPR